MRQESFSHVDQTQREMDSTHAGKLRESAEGPLAHVRGCIDRRGIGELDKGFADNVDDEATRAVLDVVGRVFEPIRCCVETRECDDGGPVANLDVDDMGMNVDPGTESKGVLV